MKAVDISFRNQIESKFSLVISFLLVCVKEKINEDHVKFLKLCIKKLKHLPIFKFAIFMLNSETTFETSILSSKMRIGMRRGVLATVRIQTLDTWTGKWLTLGLR